VGASIGIELFPTLPCALTQLVFEDCVRPWVGCAVLSTEGQLLVGGGEFLAGSAMGELLETGARSSAALDDMQIANSCCATTVGEGWAGRTMKIQYSTARSPTVFTP
jgi:hypothetical protein